MKLFTERNIKDDDVSPAFEKAAKRIGLDLACVEHLTRYLELLLSHLLKKCQGQFYHDL